MPVQYEVLLRGTAFYKKIFNTAGGGLLVHYLIARLSLGLYGDFNLFFPL